MGPSGKQMKMRLQGLHQGWLHSDWRHLGIYQERQIYVTPTSRGGGW